SAYRGDTVLAARRFADWAPPDLNVVVLVDFENDSVRTALEVANELGSRLWGVRLDTSESLVDRSLWAEMGDFKPTGVNERHGRSPRILTVGAAESAPYEALACTGDPFDPSPWLRSLGLKVVRVCHDTCRARDESSPSGSRTGLTWKRGRPHPLGRRHAGRLH